MNFPLVDVLTEEVGPVEIVTGTHLLSVHAGKDPKAYEGKLEPVWFNLGDVSLAVLVAVLLPVLLVLLMLTLFLQVIVRDVRGLHRGTPNRSPKPREMVVVGYSRGWLRRPEVGLRVKRSFFEGLDKEGQHLLRFEEVVADAEFGAYTGREKYDAAALAAASGKSYSDETTKEL